MNCIKDSAGERFRSGSTDGRKREGASTVSLNHPLAANLREAGELCGNFNSYSWPWRRFALPFRSLPMAARLQPDLVPIGAGLGMGLAAGLCGLGQGKAVGSATEALARNPGTRPGIMLFLVLGLAFIESLTLFTMVMVFVKM